MDYVESSWLVALGILGFMRGLFGFGALGLSTKPSKDVAIKRLGYHGVRVVRVYDVSSSSLQFMKGACGV